MAIYLFNVDLEVITSNCFRIFKLKCSRAVIDWMVGYMENSDCIYAKGTCGANKFPSEKTYLFKIYSASIGINNNYLNMT